MFMPGFSIGSESIVLDFSALNEDAKSFYAELVLRQLYSDMEQGKRRNMLIVAWWNRHCIKETL